MLFGIKTNTHSSPLWIGLDYSTKFVARSVDILELYSDKRQSDNLTNTILTLETFLNSIQLFRSYDNISEVREQA